MTAKPRRPADQRRDNPLTAEVIAEAALRIADEKGVDGISTRRLGEALGCAHTAVYLHFKDRDALLKAVFDLAVSRAPHTVSRDGGWEDRARAVCAAIRRTLLDHPVCYELAQRFPGRGVGLWAADLDWIAEQAGYAPKDAAGVARLLSEISIGLASNTAHRAARAEVQGAEQARPEERSLVLNYNAIADEAVFATVVECVIDGLRRGVRLDG